MNIGDFKSMIDRFLAGTASQMEIKYIQQWLDATEAEEIVLTEEERDTLAQEMRQQVAARTGVLLGQGRQWKKFWLRCAAVIATAITGSSLFLLLTRTHTPQTTAVNYRHFEAPPGQLRKILLTDSTAVYLFPGAALHVPDEYGESRRYVQIEGRAFFDVRPHPGKIFSVQAGKLLTTVLGTSFEVRAAGFDAPAIVTVRSGKVRVQYGERQLSDIGAGNRLVYDTSGTRYVLEKVAVNDMFNWISGTLAFRQVPLTEVCMTIEDWFKVKIIIRNKRWEQEKVTANLNGQSLDTTMHVLSQTLGFKYEKAEGLITIY